MDVKDLNNKLISEGKLIEAGFLGLKTMVISKDASEIQLSEMRMAFFAGAQHLMSSVITVLDPGIEPTEDDLVKLNNIIKELVNFQNEFNSTIKARMK